MGKKRKAPQLGFALTLELLLGMFLLVLAILALFTLFPTSDRAMANADNRAQALYLARQLMEKTMAEPYASLPVANSSGTQTVQPTLRRGARASLELLYRVEVTQPDPAKEIKDVIVVVSWSRQSRDSQVTLSGSKGRLW